MFQCPNCHVFLRRAQTKAGVFWFCTSCNGRSATISLLRRNIERETVNSLWNTARAAGLPHPRSCPSCANRMAEVQIPTATARTSIDVCTRCQFVWFDPREYETLPKQQQQDSFLKSLPPEARERIAMLEVEAIQKAADSDEEHSGPSETWHYIPALLGLPIEQEPGRLSSIPWATWSLAAVIALFSLTAFSDLEPMIKHFGLIPSDPLRFGGLTLATSFFVHGGLFHLLSNLYFLLIFGDNVEQALGRWKFLLLVVLATLVGEVAHVGIASGSDVPCVGASGGIAGILTYYALAFPQARIGLFLRFGILIKWVSASAQTLFFVWLLMQGVGVWLQLAGLSNVSSMGHLGGVAAGILFWVAQNRCASTHAPPLHR